MTPVVLDTSALLYWTLEPERLSHRAAALLREGEIIVSSISLWEIALKHRQGRLELPISSRQFALELSHVDSLRILPVDTEVWLRNVELCWDHRDPADRTIVATAQGLGCPLVTSDQKILQFYSRAVW